MQLFASTIIHPLTFIVIFSIAVAMIAVLTEAFDTSVQSRSLRTSSKYPIARRGCRDTRHQRRWSTAGRPFAMRTISGGRMPPCRLRRRCAAVDSPPALEGLDNQGQIVVEHQRAPPLRRSGKIFSIKTFPLRPMTRRILPLI